MWMLLLLFPHSLSNTSEYTQISQFINVQLEHTGSFKILLLRLNKCNYKMSCAEFEGLFTALSEVAPHRTPAVWAQSAWKGLKSPKQKHVLPSLSPCPPQPSQARDPVWAALLGPHADETRVLVTCLSGLGGEQRRWIRDEGALHFRLYTDESGN